MIESISNLIKTRMRLSGVLGLNLDGNRLEAVLLERTNGSAQVTRAFTIPLTLDPLTNDPVLVGREIRNHLNTQGIREKRCVLGLPAKWALTALVHIPELPEAEISSLLRVEAERAFPCDVANLQVGCSQFKSPTGTRHATLAGMPRSHVQALESALRAAQLKPLSFSLSASALQPPEDPASEGAIAVIIGEAQVVVQATLGGGVAVLRALEGALENSAGTPVLNTDTIIRETRITLGQLGPEVRQAIKSIRIFGPANLARQLADELELRLEGLGGRISVVMSIPAAEYAFTLPVGQAPTPALILAARALAGRTPAFEFLPPQINRLREFSERYASGPLRTAATVGGAVFGLVALLFLVQQWQLSSLNSRWKRMETQVRELETLQHRVRQFRPWFDESFRSLAILRQLTTAFPEDGSVSARVIELRDPDTVSCSGVARDNRGWLRTLERLRASGNVADLKVDRIQGKSPLQFTFDFRWVEGGQSAN
jgi:hypothetical protein